MVALLSWEDYWLVRKGPKGKVMSDLYEFPYFDVQEELHINPTEIVKQSFGLDAVLITKMAKEAHSFTRFQVSLFPYLLKCREKPEIHGYEWIKSDKLSVLPFSSGHRRIFEKIKIQIC